MTMTTTTAPSATTPRSARIAYGAMRGLLAFFGVFGALAAGYFGFAADPADGGITNGFDLFVTLWKIALSVAFLAAALAPRLDRGQRITVARWAVAAELVFDAIKIGHYHESAALGFSVVDCVLMAVVLLAGRSTRTT